MTDSARLRREVRAFIAEERSAGRLAPQVDGWFFGFSREFSRAMGARGWIGMTWPAEYGGAQRPPGERFVVIEELLAAGAPMNAHWVSDRQTGPSLLRFGSEAQRRRFLPGMAAGEVATALGMSEPGAGSDLAAVATRAERVAGGWELTGTKIWTGNAHRADLLVVLARTDPNAHRSTALTQFIVELPSDRVAAEPIPTTSGHRHFCRVELDRVFVPDELVLGDVGAGWAQVTAELADERGGPERFLSLLPLLEGVRRAIAARGRDRFTTEWGLVTARVSALRALAVSLLDEREGFRLPRAIRAAAFKSAATQFEADALALARRVSAEVGIDDDSRDLLRYAVSIAPAAGLRGGTTQILDGIVARGLS